MTFDDIVRFYEQNILNRPRVITLYGNMKKIDAKQLSKFGGIKKVKTKEIRVD
jgi:hypothetical protein